MVRSELSLCASVSAPAGNITLKSVGGVHALRPPYYLAANHGITNVAVMDKATWRGGSGAYAILRQLPDAGGRPFYDRSLSCTQPRTS